MSDLAEHYNKAIAKSTRNPLTSSPYTSLPPTSSLPTFKLLVSSPPVAFKRVDCYYTSTSLKKQANRIAAQNIQYKIAFKSYVLTIPF